MAKHTKMVANNKSKSDEMLNLSLTTISEMLQDGEKVQISELVRRTGFSRSYFYKNEIVGNAINEAIKMQTGKVFPNKKEEAIIIALKRENKLLRDQNEALKKQYKLLSDKVDSMSASEVDYIESL